MDKTEVTLDEVKHVAKLAKLNFSDEEIKKMQCELNDILGEFKKLNDIDLSDVDLTIEDTNKKFRKDEVKVFTDKKKLMQNVKTLRDGAIEVPKIIE
ncbi:Asp-tRNA(Asn)/Glu-tRNA(Gln) amidotransferase subunit GatC [Inconstantimicrobium porci]|uniref:Aspartyl/glutamyl-tRNA(Asn/Gln) amidotransferase subunit C n=1 Tax=Inconstantimicrobium porci TaxID=2652291 RepID=A0A7X2T0G5_9CLOT|nr:Asp-tRNA(Asn)/Glu-tRNA(Gln) amidotransferase subunit GatC [Inconstantimicrobium porci]MDD6769952.1 Asp-tRNA(Asn)/Glu-tRNA(Gln) amidotransferase subunit GatC [Inconstantimicrobium porci]MSR90494.1 Asp-tRNA(Asn)/Glu-tRNA(Gln) amidotransferase subunit GatC [Inconstantimicrobium porci]